jgi:Family of unknown function (DUF5682)
VSSPVPTPARAPAPGPDRGPDPAPAGGPGAGPAGGPGASPPGGPGAGPDRGPDAVPAGGPGAGPEAGAQRPEVRVFGIRHHGPGSARSVRAALEAYEPDVVLVEGPADADPLLPLVAAAGMRPPVALLAYAADDPRAAIFWPFAVFSPEWQALDWAATHGVPAHCCDLPATNLLADRPTPSTPPESTKDTNPPAPPAAAGAEQEGEGNPPAPEAPAGPAEPPGPAGPAEPPGPGGAAEPDGPEDGAGGGEDIVVRVRRDPLAILAEAAGFDDPERWWEDLVESRRDGDGPFEAITEAMAELRAAAPEPDPAEQQREDRREAYMRTVLRTALKMHRKVAIVCGAWHAPALTAPLPTAAADARVLAGMPKRKVALTWTPWTHGRLAAASGYGAGVTSPGWYDHLFNTPDLPVARWLTKVAGALREEDLPVSSAHVIEAVRLAEALAVLRGRPLAGLAEVTEATRAVLVDGDELMLDLVARRLVVGEALGQVPDAAPAVPLAVDLAAQARKTKLKQDALEKTYELDLRKPTDLARSRLLHRLRLLGIEWGTPARAAARNLGTFRETWSLTWRPELAVDIVEASVWGTTVAAAAAARVADAPGTLVELTSAVEATLLADLPDALPPLLAALDARAAADTDVAHLMEALPALVRALRYGDVRDTDTSALDHVADALLVRIRAGLPAALTALDDESATLLRTRITGVHAAVALREKPAARDGWLTTLADIAGRDDVHGLVTGQLVRLLLDGGRIDTAEAGIRLSRALSVGSPPPAQAAWVEGFLEGGGLLLVHDAALLGVLDDWVGGLAPDTFTDVLPLLRRTFGSFAAPERRSLGDRIKRGPAAATGTDAEADLDQELAAAVLPTVSILLGGPR